MIRYSRLRPTTALAIVRASARGPFATGDVAPSLDIRRWYDDHVDAFRLLAPCCDRPTACASARRTARKEEKMRWTPPALAMAILLVIGPVLAASPAPQLNSDDASAI